MIAITTSILQKSDIQKRWSISLLVIQWLVTTLGIKPICLIATILHLAKIRLPIVCRHSLYFLVSLKKSMNCFIWKCLQCSQADTDSLRISSSQARYDQQQSPTASCSPCSFTRRPSEKVSHTRRVWSISERGTRQGPADLTNVDTASDQESKGGLGVKQPLSLKIQ